MNIPAPYFGTRDAAEIPKYTFPYQPIVHAGSREVVSYEALIRGPNREGAPGILGQVPHAEKYRFDEESRVVAIELAARLKLSTWLNLNFLPRSLEQSRTAIDSTLSAARRCGIDADRIVIEVTEDEVIDDHAHFARAITQKSVTCATHCRLHHRAPKLGMCRLNWRLLSNSYRRDGLRIAIDDFGAGYSGLNLLADFQPDIVKLDMKLVRGIESHGPRQAIVRAIAQASNDLGINVIAEGVETTDEYLWFRDEGITLFQGYLFARPGFEELALPQFPNAR